MRSNSTARFTIAKTHNSSNAVVPPSVRTPLQLASASATTVVQMIANHGVRRRSCTAPNTRGIARSFAMPYSRRDAIMRLINDVLPTAVIAITENTTSGNHGAPTRTTSSKS